jgi:hypothetical protein
MMQCPVGDISTEVAAEEASKILGGKFKGIHDNIQGFIGAAKVKIIMY